MASSEFQKIVGETLRTWFPKTPIIENYRPKWMKGLELDFYLPKLHFAVEAQGRQHYKFCPDFHATFEDFIAQRKRDKLKRALAREHNIHLVQLKYPCFGKTRLALLARWIQGIFAHQGAEIDLPSITPELQLKWRLYLKLANQVHHRRTSYSTNRLISIAKKRNWPPLFKDKIPARSGNGPKGNAADASPMR